MATGLVHLHNVLRWIILILLLISIAKAYSGWKGKKTFSAWDKKVWLFTMTAAHITFLLGLAQLFFGRYGIVTSSLPEGTSLMKNKFYRFFWIEHPLIMIISVALITVGYGMSKKNVPDEVKYRKAFIYFLVALIFILIGIPWPFREVIGRPILPGM
jgi:hypothetical protein